MKVRRNRMVRNQIRSYERGVCVKDRNKEVCKFEESWHN